MQDDTSPLRVEAVLGHVNVRLAPDHALLLKLDEATQATPVLEVRRENLDHSNRLVTIVEVLVN